MLAIDHIDAADRCFGNDLAIGIDIHTAMTGLCPFPYITGNVGDAKFVLTKCTCRTDFRATLEFARALLLIVLEPP